MAKRSGSDAGDDVNEGHTSEEASHPPLSGADGVSARLIRELDWSKTALGPAAHWPRSLGSLVGTMLHSRHPMFLWWGPELVQFYNDAYLPSIRAGKHPRAMGQRGRECWPEIWSIIAPQIEDVMLRAKASWNEDALVPIQRNGRVEEVYWSYGYSPAFDDDGKVGGTLVVCTETTQRVLGARRADLVRRVNEGLAALAEPGEIMPAAQAVLHESGSDVPFFEVHAATAGAAEAPAPRSEQLSELSTPRVCAPWPEPVTQAFEITCRAPAASLVFGLSPRLPFDAAYREFLKQIVEQIEHAAARIQAFRVRAVAEAERRNLIMQAPIATALVTGPRHVYELANPQYLEMVGGRDVLGKAYVEAFPEVAGSELERVMDRVYQTGEPYFAEEYLVPLERDGRVEDVYFRFNLEPIRNSDGQVYGVMAVALDISPQVTARRVVEKSAAEREKLLAELEAASRAKDEFLATVSHELRTPLTSILGWARLLHESGEPSRVKKGIAVIERNAKAQAQLIEDILDVSRIVSGKVRLNMTKLEPAAVIAAAIETVRPLADAKQQELRVSLKHPLPTITADEDRLQQVVWNLLSNAVKFTPQGGRIEVQAAAAADDSLTITITDNGAGISPHFLPHVFDRFRQDDNSTTKQHAGLGLGLSIVRHLTELHGGTVTVASAGVGQGACFSVTMPLRPLTPAPALLLGQAAEHAPSNAEASRALLAGARLLVVDDQGDARELIATVLEDAGAIVTQANTVRAALAALATHHTDLVISDIGMPEEDGYSFIARLRGSAPAIRNLPAVAVTAFARAEDRARALGAGFNEHISKPIDPRALVEVAARFVVPRAR